MVKVRAATEDDLPAILEMGRALHAESPRYAAMSYNEAKVEALALRVIPTGGTLVAEKDGKIIGMLAGYVAEHWFSDDKVASDFTFYIRPEHRRTGKAALLLVRAFERWAVERGAKDIMPGVSTQIDVERTTRFFEKLGYTVYGNALLKRVN